MIEQQTHHNNTTSAHGKEHRHDDGSFHTHDHDNLHTQTKAVLNRLARAIGHLTKVRKMVEEGRDCSEVLIQLAAVRSAINRTCEVILKDHLEHCIANAHETGERDTLDELRKAVELLLK
jgi:DNA-binding FrmR family transcriptional regulator